MGMPVQPVTEREAVERVVGAAERREGGWVLTPNLELLRRHVADPDVRPHFEAADVIVPDGMPLLWASRVAGTPLPERVAGSSLIWSVTARAAERELPVFLLGGNSDAAPRARETLRRTFPSARIVGTHTPPFGFEHDEAELEAIETAIARSRPRIVFVGLAFPKQERLIARLRAAFPDAWFLGVGVSFSFVAGELRRPPEWVQRLGMEWMYRLAQEPGRLYRRYAVDGLPFAARLLGWAVRRRVATALR